MFSLKVTNNIWRVNFNFFHCQILYPVAKFAPFKAEKVVFSRIWVILFIHKSAVYKKFKKRFLFLLKNRNNFCKQELKLNITKEDVSLAIVYQDEVRIFDDGSEILKKYCKDTILQSYYTEKETSSISV